MRGIQKMVSDQVAEYLWLLMQRREYCFVSGSKHGSNVSSIVDGIYHTTDGGDTAMVYQTDYYTGHEANTLSLTRIVLTV